MKNGFDFYITHDNWHYTYKNGWHDYMTSLKPWNPDLKYDEVDYLEHGYGEKITSKYTMSEYEAITKELFSPNELIYKKAREFMSTMPESYDSIYIRRGDKLIREISTLSMKDISTQTQLLDTCKHLFVQTDDYSVIEELQTIMPNCKIYTFTQPSERGSNNEQTLIYETPEQRRDGTERFLAEILVFINGKKCWADYRSNVGRFLKIFGFDKVEFYPRDDRSNITRSYSSALAYDL